MVRRVSLGLLISLFSFFIVACGESQQDQSFEEHLTRAAVYEEQGQYKAAIIEYKNALRKSNGGLVVALNYADMLNKLGQQPAALDLLESVTQDKTSDYYIALAKIYLKLNKFYSAEETIKAHLDGSRPEVQLLLAESTLGQGDLTSAVKRFDALLSNADLKSEAQLGKANALARMGQLDGSLALINTITPEDPAYTKARILLAGIQVGKQQLEQAEATLTDVLSRLPNTDIMEPEKVLVLERLSYVLTRQGRSNEAYIYTKILSEAFPGSNEVNTQFQEALVKMDEGKIDEAKTILLKVLETYPNYNKAMQLLGVISYFQGDIKTASSYLEGSVDPEIANDMTRHIYAATNLRLNDPKKVLEILEPGIGKTDNVATIALYGLAAISDKQFEKGEKYLLKALELDKNNVRVRMALADFYRNKPQPELVKEKVQLEAAYAIAPTDKQVVTDMVSHILRNQGAVDAEKFLKKGVEKNPADFANNFLMGAFYAAQNQFQTSLSFFDVAITNAKNETDAVNAMFGKGRAQASLKNIDAAESTFESIINKYPANPLGYKGLLAANLSNNQAENGFKKVEQYAERNKQAAAYTMLIEAAVSRQDLVSAKSYFDKFKKLNVTEQQIKELDQGIRYVEAVMAIQVKDYSEARAIAGDLLSGDPENIRLLSFLVDIEMQAGQLNEAEKILAQIEAINSKHPVLDVFKADIAIAKQDMPTAEKHLTSAWKSFPNDRVAEKLYITFGTSNQRDKQASHLENWLEVIPGSPAATLYQAIRFQQEKRIAQAVPAYEAVLEKLPNNVMALNNLGWIYFEQGDKRALSLLEKAANLAPENAAVLDSYGWVLANTGNKKQGLEYLEKALSLAPNEAEIKSHLEQAKRM